MTLLGTEKNTTDFLVSELFFWGTFKACFISWSVCYFSVKYCTSLGCAEEVEINKFLDLLVDEEGMHFFVVQYFKVGIT